MERTKCTGFCLHKLGNVSFGFWGEIVIGLKT